MNDPAPQQVATAPQGAAANPPLALATGLERELLVNSWSGAGQKYPNEPSLAARFESQAQATPDAVALRYDGASLTYGELNARANQLAHLLRERGVGPETLVGLLLDRSIELLVGLLGIVKAGGAYLPMDIAYPSDRLLFMLADAQAHLVISSASAILAVDVGTTPVLLLDSDSPAIATQPATNLETAVTSDNLAYVIYTSGSTGNPKGCAVTHGNVVRLFESTRDIFHFTASDIWTMFHSPAFDFSVWEIWGAWLYGGQLVVVPVAVARSPEQFLSLLHRERVTFLNQTPSAFKSLAAAAVAERDAPPLALRCVVFGGEALSTETLRAWMQRFGDDTPALFNCYGITETTVHVTHYRVRAADLLADGNALIGKPLPDLRVYVLNEAREVCAIGTIGELYVGGAGVTRGYLRRDDLTSTRFIEWSASPGAPLQRLYKSGDLVSWQSGGDLQYHGRLDHQVKIRGFRIELGEIESTLLRQPGVSACAVIARNDRGAEPRLVAYVVPATPAPTHSALREALERMLPPAFVPAAFVSLTALPITANGKLDARALPSPERARPELFTEYAAPRTPAEKICCNVFAEALQLDMVGRDDNFFELGGDSLVAVQVCADIARGLHRTVSVATLFTNATAALLAAALNAAPDTAVLNVPLSSATHSGEPIALIAMSARLPAADSTETFWDNLLAARDAVRFFSPDELDASIPTELRADPAYVSARSVLRDAEGFDPAFFGMSQREAEITDPQQRLLLELAWECLERAGYAPDRTADAGHTVGVFAGSYSSDYAQKQVYAHPDIVERLGAFSIMLGSDKDFVATRIAHRLNLHGPAISVHTACSSALVAIVQAFDSLQAGRCTMALAGAASMTYPTRSGHLYQDGYMLSRNGLTRTFDANATGTVFSDGGAMVLMKRLSDAVNDGDQIYAVIVGAGLNNDGGHKASFTAPSVTGQASVIAAALRSAHVPARSISYVEAHGTATPLGDPIEVEALTKAFRDGPFGTPDVGFCRIGSAKSNIGHVVSASGAVGVIKTALALWHETIPATLHFETPNPLIDFSNSPFVVNQHASAWPRGANPRRAGVSAFGVGGTNAHIVMQEAPAVAEPATVDGQAGAQVLRVSARTPTALQRAMDALTAHLRSEPGTHLADVAFTLQHGRTPFVHRAAVVAHTTAEAIAALEQRDHAARVSGRVQPSRGDLAFVFPGQGAQYAGMGSALYADDVVFRAACDEVFTAVDGILPFKLRERMFSADADVLRRTSVTQPATFCLEYALATSWQARGVTPDLMIGHSVGEFVAGALAGVMSVANAARLVARRGLLMESLPGGSMLSVRSSASRLRERLPETLSIAAENAPQLCVVSGPHEAIAAFAVTLERENIPCRLLQTSHAFHSSMMDSILDRFEREVMAVPLSAPRIPIISAVTGTMLSDDQATSPSYWARHLRETVRFSSAITTVLTQPNVVFLEVGPRGTLSTLVRQHTSTTAANSETTGSHAVQALPTLGDSPDMERASFELAVARLWVLGFVAGDARVARKGRRVRLPTYPFERVRCWLDAAPAAPRAPTDEHSAPEIEVVHAIPNQLLTAVMPESVSPDQRLDITARLRTLFEEIGGMDLGGADSSSSFVELGLDSLVLTQAAIQLKKTFAVKITFRQLMEQYRSLDSLATHIIATVPVASSAVQRIAPPVTIPSPANIANVKPDALHAAVLSPSGESASTFAQHVIQQQLAIMQQQLLLLAGNAGGLPGETLSHADTRSHPEQTTSVPSENGGADEAHVLAHRTYDVQKAFGAIARIHTRPSTEILPRQQQRLDAFMRRYIERTKASKVYTETHRAQLADPRVVNGFRPQTKEICYQLVVNRSNGAYVWDIDGNKYVDALNGFGMNLFGWQPEFVNVAVRRQLDEGHEIGPLHPLAGEVASLVCELTGFDRAGFCNTGSEAVLGAVRVARTVTGRDLIVIFTTSYHGIFDEVLVRGTRTLRSVPAAPGILQAAAENVLVLDYGTPEALQIIRDRAPEIAAVVVEPVQSRRPDFQPTEFLQELRAITTASETLLIFDEVITGFRSHPGGAQEVFGIRADLGCYGKVIGGGYPIGVIAGKREYMDALDGGSWQYGDDSIPSVGVTYFAGTFVRHPLALAACKAVLEHLRERGPALQQEINARTTRMTEAMNRIAEASGAPVVIKHFASLWRISFTEDHPLQDLLWAMMRDRGIHILDNFPCFLTTSHTDADCATIVAAFKEALAEMQASGFLPGQSEDNGRVIDATKPPRADARLGRDQSGTPTWYVPHPTSAGKYVPYNVV